MIFAEMDSVVRGSDLDINIIIASLKYLVNKHNLNKIQIDHVVGGGTGVVAS